MIAFTVGLAALPCDCVIDAEGVSAGNLVHGGERITVIECPWCGATFLASAYEVWRREGAEPILVQQKPQVVRFGSTLLEFFRQCEDCSAPIVRERGGVKFHLRVSAQSLTWCGN